MIKRKTLKSAKKKKYTLCTERKKMRTIAVVFGKNANEKMEQSLNVFELIS